LLNGYIGIRLNLGRIYQSFNVSLTDIFTYSNVPCDQQEISSISTAPEDSFPTKTQSDFSI